MIYTLVKIKEMADGDEDFILSIVTAFLEEIPQDLADLEEAVNSRDHEKAYQLAHKIKPNVDILGMEQTRILALDIESLSKNQGSFEEIEAKFPALKRDVLQVIEELQSDFGI
ncbi:MAG: Hpt domain-containing protein [Flavobacteriaceae bacterium]|nr:Hpt domain-containing protein [Flavobacteriaceae bacterium]